MEPTDLDRARVQHRARLREDSSHVTVALPHTEGDLGAALSALEDVLLLVGHGADDCDLPLPAGLDREALDAVGRLASYVATVERSESVVQPVAPDGRYELVPLFFVPLGRHDQRRILSAIAQVSASTTTTSYPVLDEAIGAYARNPQDAEELVGATTRLGALLAAEGDDDIDLLHPVLSRSASAGGRPPERVVLTDDQYQAYQRVIARVLATWHSGDHLAAFLYRGGTQG